MRARDEILKSNLQPVGSCLENGLVFKLQGSAGEPYTVVFEKTSSNVTAKCNCPAGRFSTCCKHRIALLEGDVTALVSGNEFDLLKLKAMLEDSDVGNIYSRFQTCNAANIWITRLKVLDYNPDPSNLALESVIEILNNSGFLVYRDVFTSDQEHVGICGHGVLPKVRNTCSLSSFIKWHQEFEFLEQSAISKIILDASEYQSSRKALQVAFRD